jgi:hypothetical protein
LVSIKDGANNGTARARKQYLDQRLRGTQARKNNKRPQETTKEKQCAQRRQPPNDTRPSDEGESQTKTTETHLRAPEKKVERNTKRRRSTKLRRQTQRPHQTRQSRIHSATQQNKTRNTTGIPNVCDVIFAAKPAINVQLTRPLRTHLRCKVDILTKSMMVHHIHNTHENCIKRWLVFLESATHASCVNVYYRRTPQCGFNII